MRNKLDRLPVDLFVPGFLVRTDEERKRGRREEEEEEEEEGQQEKIRKGHF